MNRDWIASRVDIEGMEQLDAALAKGCGAVLLSAHVGNWELGAMALSRLGYPVHAVAVSHKDPAVDRIFLKRREGHGIRTLPIGGFMRAPFRVLARNQVVAMNADRHYAGDFFDVPFLGRTVRYPSGFARLARWSGADVIPCFFLPQPGGRYRMTLLPPLEPSGDEAMAREFAAVVERIVRENPTLWFVFERFDETPKWPR